MEKYDFDKVIDRRGTGAMKLDALGEMFGRNDISSFWIADMDFAVSPQIIEALRKRLEHPVFGYGMAPDSYWNSIIDWLDRRHGFKVAREEMTFVPGVVKGVALAVNFYSKPGDKIIIQPPVYHPFKMVIEGNGRVALNNPLRRTSSGYEMNMSHLEQLMADEHPTMMILCNPHNPAGIQWDADTLRSVASLAVKYGVKVVSDEIHGDLMLYGGRHYPFATVSAEAESVAITLGAPSKTFNIPGLVSSWIVVKNHELRTPFFNWLMTNEFDSPMMMATIATEAAYKHGEDWLGQMLEYVEGNIAAVEKYLAENEPRIKPMRPQASFLVWLDCRELGLDQKSLVDLFVNKAGLALNDGTMFGAEGAGYMRFNVASPRAVVLDALAKLCKALK